jgi:uncharacterized protein
LQGRVVRGMASKTNRPRRGRRKGWTGYVLSFLLGALLVVLGYTYFSHLTVKKAHRPEPPSRKIAPADKITQGPRSESGITKKDIPPSLPPLKTEEGEPPAPKAGGRPKIAIVIDDLGGENHLSKELLLFDVPITFSILPFMAHSRSLALEAHQKGKEVILHLPMEPHGYPKVKPGEGALLGKMNEETLLRQLAEDIESVPNIKGVSNHMGSRFMEDPDKVTIVLSDLKRRGLFFFDSRTTPQTVGLKTAKVIGLKAVERTLFIDHSLKQGDIRKKLDRLIQASLSRGMAIGIGHPHSLTIQSIREMIPRMMEKGVEIVPLSVLVNESSASERPQ